MSWLKGPSSGQKMNYTFRQKWSQRDQLKTAFPWDEVVMLGQVLWCGLKVSLSAKPQTWFLLFHRTKKSYRKLCMTAHLNRHFVYCHIPNKVISHLADPRDWKATSSCKWHHSLLVSLGYPLQAAQRLCYLTPCNATLHSLRNWRTCGFLQVPANSVCALLVKITEDKVTPNKSPAIRVSHQPPENIKERQMSFMKHIGHCATGLHAGLIQTWHPAVLLLILFPWDDPQI